jgi:hypothetical protein
MSFLFISRSHLLKVLLQRPSLLSFGVMILSKSNIAPRIRQQPPQKPELINMKNAHLRGFLLCRAWCWPKKTYQKLSSNSLDLAELEPKPVDHRQIRIDLVRSGKNWAKDHYKSAQHQFFWPPPIVKRLCTKLRAPNRGMSLGPFVCGVCACSLCLLFEF